MPRCEKKKTRRSPGLVQLTFYAKDEYALT
jgi:hypothetical protein